jgi:hypothetical protein
MVPRYHRGSNDSTVTRAETFMIVLVAARRAANCERPDAFCRMLERSIGSIGSLEPVLRHVLGSECASLYWGATLNPLRRMQTLGTYYEE